MTESNNGVPVGEASGDITLPLSSKPSSRREVILQSGGTSPTSHALSQEERGTTRARTGAGASPDSMASSRTHPLLPSLLLQPPTASQNIFPMNTDCCSHITHKLWCELLVNEDLI